MVGGRCVFAKSLAAASDQIERRCFLCSTSFFHNLVLRTTIQHFAVAELSQLCRVTASQQRTSNNNFFWLELSKASSTHIRSPPTQPPGEHEPSHHPLAKKHPSFGSEPLTPKTEHPNHLPPPQATVANIVQAILIPNCHFTPIYTSTNILRRLFGR